jgi:hypothetical protein
MNQPRMSKSDILDGQHGPPERFFAEGTTGDRRKWTEDARSASLAQESIERETHRLKMLP